MTALYIIFAVPEKLYQFVVIIGAAMVVFVHKRRFP